MGYRIRYSGVSHVGVLRDENQDNYICGGKIRSMNGKNCDVIEAMYVSPPAVFGVFDGMGGEECGDIAAMIAAKKAAEMSIGRNAVRDMRKYCTEANEAICEYMRENSVRSMGTTAAVLVFSASGIVVFNVGDSRIFRYEDGTLEQLSKDHVGTSLYGKKPPLYQNLGIPAEEMLIEPHISKRKYRAGEIFLICSDGLTDMVSEQEIVSIISNTEFEDISQALLEAAISHGGRDNITVVLCEVIREGTWFSNIFHESRGV